MKKILLIIGVLSFVLLTACSRGQEVEEGQTPASYEQVREHYETITYHLDFLLGAFGDEVATIELTRDADLIVTVNDEQFIDFLLEAKIDAHVAGVVRDTFVMLSDDIVNAHELFGVAVKIFTRENTQPFLIVQNGEVVEENFEQID